MAKRTKDENFCDMFGTKNMLVKVFFIGGFNLILLGIIISNLYMCNIASSADSDMNVVVKCVDKNNNEFTDQNCIEKVNNCDEQYRILYMIGGGVDILFVLWFFYRLLLW